MSHILKALIAGSALITMAEAASAQPTFDTVLTYDASAPAEVIYTSLDKQIMAACVAEKRRVQKKVHNTNPRFVHTCYHQMMGQVVTTSANASLISLYASRTNTPVRQTLFTELSR